MSSEAALIKQNQFLRNQLSEMEELFATQDEESREQIQHLKAEQKDLSNKV